MTQDEVARVVLDGAYVVAPVPRRLFGSFVEHMGRCVYGGVYEPGHPTADADGCRTDVQELVRELGVSLVRYPGGNFVSGYDWRDGIGPRDQRPARLDRAWKAIESNQFGTDEFLGWASRTGVEPMMAVNLGTPECRRRATCWSTATDRPAPGGRTCAPATAPATPTTYACGAWATSSMVPGRWATRPPGVRAAGRRDGPGDAAGRPRRELVACGSSNSGMPTFGTWEDTVLEHAHDLVDHVSLHAYYEEVDGDRASFLASAEDMDAMIRGVVATADAVAARKRSRKRMTLALRRVERLVHAGRAPRGRAGLRAAPAPHRGRLHRGRRRRGRRPADRRCCVTPTGSRSAARRSWSTSSRPSAPSRADPPGARRRSTRSRSPRGTPAGRCSCHPSALRGPPPRSTATSPRSRVAATHDPEAGETALFLVNRSPDAQRVEVALHDLPASTLVEHVTLADDGSGSVNDAAHPDRVRARAGTDVRRGPAGLEGRLAARSWHLLRLR